MPRILVLTVKLGVRYGRRLATPIPSSNKQIPCIRTLRISVCSVLYKSLSACTLKQMCPSFRTRRYFSHHSNKDNSLQDYPSFVGETIGTRIYEYRPLVMPPSFVRRLRNNTAQSDGTTVKLGAHILAALRLVFRLRSCTYRL